MDDLALAANQVASFIKILTTAGGMRLKYRITAGAGAADPDGLERREIYVEMAGPDAALLTQRNGEVLRALEHVAARILRLEHEEHDRVSFDANGFKAARAREMRLAADTAAEHVRLSGRPYVFPSMTSGERRMLHLALRSFDDLRTESSGEGMQRFVVAYPKDYQGEPVQPPAGQSSIPGRSREGAYERSRRPREGGERPRGDDRYRGR